jgi:oxygen-independent coproporphyrinogen-3 oxidase
MNSPSFDLLLKYDSPVPRYTSYPPAPHFSKEIGTAEYGSMLYSSNGAEPRNLSFYFHIPFCPHRCLFCGCHTEIGSTGKVIKDYLEAMKKELDLLLPWLDLTRPVTQIHFGGGTPNSVPFSHLHYLIRTLRASFPMPHAAEVAIECDPNLVTVGRLEDLAAMGFNRVSFGIQDFNPRVLDAVQRRFPKTEPAELFRAAREMGFSGNNLDLIYGLPFQTPESFRDTTQKAVAAGPDRISLFPYAHVPWVKGHQAALDGLPMPDAAARLRMALESREALERAGFEAIGMDHFALPNDDLSRAKRSGSLHRNFQGYCAADRAGQVHAIGASGISQIHAGYLHNAKDLETYLRSVAAGRLPFEAGYRLTPRDRAVRSVINGLLCRGEARLDEALDTPGLEPEWKAEYAVTCIEKLAPFEAEGLVHCDGDSIRLTEAGTWVARSIAAALDPLQLAAGNRPRYSRAI